MEGIKYVFIRKYKMTLHDIANIISIFTPIVLIIVLIQGIKIAKKSGLL